MVDAQPLQLQPWQLQPFQRRNFPVSNHFTSWFGPLIPSHLPTVGHGIWSKIKHCSSVCAFTFLLDKKLLHSFRNIVTQQKGAAHPCVPAHGSKVPFFFTDPQTDHDLDHLVPHLPLWEVAQDLHGTDLTEEKCARSRGLNGPHPEM